MKMNYVVRVCALVFYGSSLSNTCYAETGLSSSEIKKVRYLSRALLQSRAIEKKRIEVDVAPQRAEIKKMEGSLESLITNELTALLQVVLQPVNKVNQLSVSSVLLSQQSKSVMTIINPDGSTKTIMQPKVVQDAAQSMVVQPELVSANSMFAKEAAQKKNSTHRENRNKRIRESQQSIADIRVATEKKSPSRFAFWKKKSQHDLRNEHMVQAARDVEKQLTQLTQKDQIDMQTLRALKKRLTLKKPVIDLEQVEPTIQTRTRHRAQ